MSINTNEILKKNNIKLTKSLGQNFLTDSNIIKKISDTANITKEDLIIEIGPGIGALTSQLVQDAGKVIAIEIDKNLIPILKQNFYNADNLEIINADILNVDIKALINGWEGPVKVVANLPYYITTPIIMGLLETDINFSVMVFMMQKEVAQRISSDPGNKTYGAITVAAGFYSHIDIAFTVSKNCFIPKPDVDSAVVKFKRKENRIPLLDEKVFFKTIKAAFAQRRKTLVNSIGNSQLLDINKEQMTSILNELGIDKSIRAESLDINQFGEIADKITRLGGSYD